MVANAITPAVRAYSPPDPPLKEFVPARDRAFFADTTKTSLLAQASAVEEVNPYIGTELKGVQLSKLTDEEKDELALLVAEVTTEPDSDIVMVGYWAKDL
jgi:sulfonate dioxygenase